MKNKQKNNHTKIRTYGTLSPTYAENAAPKTCAQILLLLVSVGTKNEVLHVATIIVQQASRIAPINFKRRVPNQRPVAGIFRGEESGPV